MRLYLSARAKGSMAPDPIKAKELVNGDFVIVRNNNSQPVTGDGQNESTNWELDFKKDLNWDLLDLENAHLQAAKLTLTLEPRTPNITTDVIEIFSEKYTPEINLGPINSTTIQGLKQNQKATIEVDLLAEGYESEKIMDVFKRTTGVIPLRYRDDSIVSFAQMRLCFEIKEKDCKLCVEAISEDTIAAPGNRRPNYVLVSVSDSCGKPVKGLTQANFNIDALIVGPGGALVNIDRVEESPRIDGFYFLFLTPIRSETWKSGVYIFGLAVEDNGKQGQTLASVLMD